MFQYDEIAIEIELSGAGGGWTDISEDVLPPIYFSAGILGNELTDRVASPGAITFALNNSSTNSGGLDGYYSPGHVNCRSGFDVGIVVRLKITIESLTVYSRYRVYAEGIIVAPGSYGKRITKVTAYDWMEESSINEVVLPTLVYDKTADEIIQSIVGGLPASAQPKNVSLESGVTEFNTAFDLVRKKTKARSEFVKYMLAEFGYIYRMRNQADGETLRMENRTVRSLIASLQPLRVPADESDYLVTENDDYLVTENDDYLMVSTSQEASFDGADIIGMPDTERGNHLYNSVRVLTHPRYVDSTTVQLWELTKPFTLAPDEEKTYTIYFRDPNNKDNKIAGFDIINPPVSGTDYDFNSSEGGGGTDLNASLTITYVSVGANGVEIYVKNNHGSLAGWMVTQQVRGKGIYTYDQIESQREDETSIQNYGLRELSIDMQAQDEPLYGDSFADLLLEQNKEPVSIAEWLLINANRSSKCLYGLLQLEIGTRFHFDDAQVGFDYDCVVNGYEGWIYDNGIVNYKLYPVIYSSGFGYWYLGVVGSSELGITTRLGV